MRTLIYIVLLVSPLLTLTSCGGGGGGGEETPTPDQPAEVILTQDMLDAASVTRAVKSGVHRQMRPDLSGTDPVPVNPRLWTGEVLQNMDPNNYLRTVTSTAGSTALNPGTVWVTHVYSKQPNGSQGDLINIGVMVKHPTGYFPQGGDWEYILIDPNSVTPQRPNGLVTAATFRGKETDCAACHSRAGKNFIFSH